MQNSFDAGEIDAQITHQAANMHNTLDIAIRIQARAMWAISFACRRDKPKAFVVAQGLLMYLGLRRSYTNHVPCAINSLRHNYPSFRTVMKQPQHRGCARVSQTTHALR